MTRTFVHSRDRIRRRVKSWMWVGVAATCLGVKPEFEARAQTFLSSSGAATEGDPPTGSFASTFGLDAERRALDLGGQPRRRALLRLFALSHRIPAQVAQVLDQWLATEPKLSPEETWALLRPMATLGAEPAMRHYLGKTLAGEALGVEAKSPYASLIAEVAALALAKHRTPETIALLSEWLRRPSERAVMVRQALLTHRPRSVSPLLEASGPATPLLLQTLGDLGDTRAIPYLRQVVKRATADIQAAAAVALAKLGVDETQDLATLWIGRSDSPSELLHASTFILLRFGHPDRTKAFARLTRVDLGLALTLAEQVPSDPAMLALADRLTELSNSNDQRRALRVLGGLGERALPRLIRLMKERAELRWEVARILGDQGTPRTMAALQPLLAVPETRAAALCALVVLFVRHSLEDRGVLMTELERSTRSPTSVERSVAKNGLAILDEQRARRYLHSVQPSEVGAAAIAAAVHGPSYLRACLLELEKLTRSEPALGAHVTPRILALSSVLSFVSPRDVVSSRLLRVLGNSPHPIVESARWQGWVRGGADAGSGLTAGDPSLALAPIAAAFDAPGRTHSASDAFTLLDSLASELNPEVRAATVNALRSRSNLRSVAETLDWSASYDPSPLVRKLAAAEVTHESTLRALWVTPPAANAPSAGYWVTVTGADRAPTVVYLSQSENAVVFIRCASAAEESPVRDSDSNGIGINFGELPAEPGAIPFHVQVQPHPSPTLR